MLSYYSTMNNKTITIKAVVKATLEQVWECWTTPKHIKKWNNANKDWHTTKVVNELRTGGRFVFRMEAKDGSFGFDFGGTYTKIVPEKQLAYKLDDDRKAIIDFEEKDDKVTITETFDTEDQNPVDMQKQGWQAILDNFKKYVEAHG